MTKTRVTAYLTAMFLTGAVAGGLGGYTLAHRRAFVPPGRQDMSAHLAQLARTNLKLSDKQMQDIQPILNDTAAQFQTTYCHMTDQINEILCNASERMAPYLSPEQKQMLEALDRQREERFHDALTQAGK